MTIADNYAPIRQIGDGVTTQFSASWSMIAAAYATVFLEDATTGVQTAVAQGAGANQYQIAITASGFTVTFGTAPTASQYAVIGRTVTKDQSTPYKTSRGFQGPVEEASFDKLTALVQQLSNQAGRNISATLGDTANLQLPKAALRANSYLTFDASGNVTISSGLASVAVSPIMTPVVQSSTLPLARTAMGVPGLSDNNIFSGNNTFSGVLSGILSSVCDFRLTLVAGTAVWDSTSSSTVYCTPYLGTKIALYNGSSWVLRNSNEVSIALSGLTTGLPYDVFAYDNSGALALEYLAWSTVNARATGLTKQDGTWVKNGNPTRRYLGTFLATSSTTTRDDWVFRYLWNFYNRRPRAMLVHEATNTWTYTVNTWRQANNSTNNQLNFVVGLNEDAVIAHLNSASSNTTINVQQQGGIGLNSTVSPYGMAMDYLPTPAATIPMTHMVSAVINGADLFVGKNFLSWLESSGSTGTTTWYGQNIYGIKGVVQS